MQKSFSASSCVSVCFFFFCFHSFTISVSLLLLSISTLFPSLSPIPVLLFKYIKRLQLYRIRLCLLAPVVILLWCFIVDKLYCKICITNYMYSVQSSVQAYHTTFSGGNLVVYKYFFNLHSLVARDKGHKVIDIMYDNRLYRYM